MVSLRSSHGVLFVLGNLEFGVSRHQEPLLRLRLSMPPPTWDSYFGQGDDSPSPNPKWTKWLLHSIVDLRELPPTLVSATVTTAFTLHLEGLGHGLHEGKLASDNDIGSFLEFLLHPSPAVMIVACIVLGCCVSSFLFRHRKQDRFQAEVFALAVIWGVVLGYGLQASTNMLLLGVIPCSLSAAMMISATGHSFARYWCSRAPRPSGLSEKENSGIKV